MKAIKRKWVTVFFSLMTMSIVLFALSLVSYWFFAAGAGCMALGIVVSLLKCRCPYCNSPAVIRYLQFGNKNMHCPHCGQEICKEV